MDLLTGLNQVQMLPNLYYPVVHVSQPLSYSFSIKFRYLAHILRFEGFRWPLKIDYDFRILSDSSKQMVKMSFLWKIRLPVILEIISRLSGLFLGEKAYFWAVVISAKNRCWGITGAINKKEKI